MSLRWSRTIFVIHHISGYGKGAMRGVTYERPSLFAWTENIPVGPYLRESPHFCEVSHVVTCPVFLRRKYRALEKAFTS